MTAWRPASPARAARHCPICCGRFADAGGRYYVCPICFDARKLGKSDLLAGAELNGTAPLWQWIGDHGATTFSY